MTAFHAFFTTSSQYQNEARTLLWELTLHQVLQLLQEAERRVRSAEGKEKYSRLPGWWRSSFTRVNGIAKTRVPLEEAISEAIVAEIENLLEEIVLNRSTMDLRNVNDLQFSLEAPRRKKQGIGKKSKPTDIRVYRRGSEILDLRIEAKVLVRDRDIQKSYLSSSGLKRFSDTKEPYTDNEVGGMLAYTVHGDRTAWVEKIKNGLDTSTPPIPSFQHRINDNLDEFLFCQVPYTSAKQNLRSEVLVFHMVMEFDSEPPGR